MNTKIWEMIKKFQSLKGLQPKWNGKWEVEMETAGRVSIPKRVTAKVEPESFIMILRLVCFNP